LSDDLFGSGVASGDPTASSIVLWTRIAPRGPRPVEVEWWLGAEGGDHRLSGTALCDGRRDSTVHVLVEGLRAGTRYRYGFKALGSSSDEGRFRTLPGDRSPLRLAVVACAKYNAGYFNAYRAIAAREDVDLVVHLGDYIYEAANVPPPSQTPGADIGRDFDPLEECRQAAQYRRRYAQYRSDPDVRALHAAHAILPILDDHELADNAWSGGADEHDEGRDGPWPARMHAALSTWEDWLPVARRPSRGEPIWLERHVGDLATLVLLETRTHRTAPTAAPEDRDLLGERQTTWLREILRSSTARWLVLGVSSMVAPIWAPRLDEDAIFALEKLKLLEPATGRPFHDLWDSYPRVRAWLTQELRRAASTPIVLSGDVHVAVEATIARGGEPVAHEWVTTSVTSQNLDDKMSWPPRTKSLRYEEAFVAGQPHVHWCDFDSNGYLIVTLTESLARCEWWSVATVKEPSSEARIEHTAVVAAATE
jgi:alkaline phosphatase D